MRNQIAIVETPGPTSPSPVPPSIASPSRIVSIESACEWVMSSAGLPLTLLLLILAAECLALTARAKATTFWYDELLTYHVSRLQPFAQFWKALESGADGMTPGYYLIIRALNPITGNPEVVLRLPSMLGYFLTLLSLYWFTHKRLPATASIAVVLLVAISPFRSYAFEARSYALLTGLLALSAVIWQRIGQRKEHDRFKTPLLALTLFLAVSSHHLAVFALSAFVLAEAVQDYTVREVRWPVWVAIAFGAIPFFLDLPLILHLKQVTGQHFWTKSNWDDAYKTYSHYLGLDWQLSTVFVAFLGIFTVACLLTALHRANGFEGGLAKGAGAVRNRSPFNVGEFSLAEIALVAGFVAFPALLVIITKVLHSGGYAGRYGLPSVFGMSIGIVYLLRPIWSKSYSVFLLVALTIVFVLQESSDLLRPHKTGQSGQTTSSGVDPRWVQLQAVSQQHPGLPVVIACGTTYLEVDHYAPPELKPKLIEVADGPLATRIIGSDTVDVSNRILAKFIPLNVKTLSGFESSTSRFLLYSGGDFDWLTNYLVRNGYKLNLVASDRSARIYIAER